MRQYVGAVIGVVLLIAGCGAPREAVMLAAREKTLTTMPAENDQQVRERLLSQEGAWRRLSQLVQEREFGGLTVDERFTQMVREVAALARRQRELIERGEDDPQLNRQSLDRFGSLWTAAERYLSK